MLVSHQADFHAALGREHFLLFQAIGTRVAWTWEMADDNRYMAYSVGSTDSNVSVTVESASVRRSNDNRLTVSLLVRVDPFDRGTVGGVARLNFFAVRIPPLA
jgi:hypothetical protein